MSRFVAIVQGPAGARAYGVYRSFRLADREATAVGGFCVALEGRNAERRWSADPQAGRL